MVFPQRYFLRLSHATLIFSACHPGSTELRKMPSLQNIQSLIRDQYMENSVSSHLPALTWYGVGCQQLWKQKSLLHIKTKLLPNKPVLWSFQPPYSLAASPPSAGLCAFGRAANTLVSCVWVTSVTQKFHISRLIWEDIPEIDPDCKLKGRNFPQCNFWRTLISHLSPEETTLLGLSIFFNTLLLALAFSLANKAQQTRLLCLTQYFSKHLF